MTVHEWQMRTGDIRHWQLMLKNQKKISLRSKEQAKNQSRSGLIGKYRTLTNLLVYDKTELFTAIKSYIEHSPGQS